MESQIRYIHIHIGLGWALGPLGPWALLGLGPTWALGPLGPWAHLGPGPSWALGPLGPWALLGPGPLGPWPSWALALLDPGPLGGIKNGQKSTVLRMGWPIVENVRTSSDIVFITSRGLQLPYR